MHIAQVVTEDPASEDEPSSPETPRVDKGKARAEPEEIHEKVLSPSFMVSSSDDSEDEGKSLLVSVPEVDSTPSPTKLYVTFLPRNFLLIRSLIRL